MAEGKWISDLQASTPLIEAAHLAISVRFGVVEHFLPLAIDHSEQDIEHVHQLRVAVRRSGAALEMLASCVPPSIYKQARKALSKIRRAAGEAREMDVFLLHLIDRREKVSSMEEVPAIDYLIGLTRRQREQAQAPLQKLKKRGLKRFTQARSSLLESIVQPEAANLRTLEDLARPQIAEVLQDLNAALAENLYDYAHLHRVRIIGKRLRYTMELFVDCFDASFKKTTYPKVEKMQKILGNANDSYVAVERLSQLQSEADRLSDSIGEQYGPGFSALLVYHENRLEKLRQSFQDWLADWRKIEVVAL